MPIRCCNATSTPAGPTGAGGGGSPATFGMSRGTSASSASSVNACFGSGLRASVRSAAASAESAFTSRGVTSPPRFEHWTACLTTPSGGTPWRSVPACATQTSAKTATSSAANGSLRDSNSVDARLTATRR